MIINSLGYKTDLIIHRFAGRIDDYESYIAIYTPLNPTWHNGNYLLFKNPPADGDIYRWQELFDRLIVNPLSTDHYAFGWDTQTGELGNIEPFLKAGFVVSNDIALTSREIGRPQKYNAGIEIRILTEDWEWENALNNQIICRYNSGAPSQLRDSDWKSLSK